MDQSVNQYVTDALRLCGQMELPGRGMAPEQLTEGAQFLNRLLDSWNTMRNALYAIRNDSYPLTANTQFYIIGPNATATTIGGDPYGAIVAPRPQKITEANLLYQTVPLATKIPLKIIDVPQRADIRVPNIFSVPLELYYDNGYSQSAPTGQAVIFLWPGPQIGYALELFTWQALPANLNADDTLYVPPGYARALTSNLALELPGGYRKNLTDRESMRLEKIAQESRYWVESLNAPCDETPVFIPTSQRPGRSRFNWLSPLG